MVHVAHSDCGKFAITCGPQFLRKYITGDTNEPVNLDLDADGLCLAVSRDNIAVGCDDGSLKLFSLSGQRYTNDIYGGSSPIHDIQFSPDGQWAAISAYDKSIIVNVDDITTTQTISHPSRHISWHPSDDLLTVSGQDSTLYFYRDGKIESKMEGILPSLDIADQRTSSANWSPAGDLFGVPSKSFDYVIYDKEKHLEQFRLVHKEPLMECKWSPNGRYVACLLVTGTIYIWNVVDRATIALEKLESAQHFSWHPNDNAIRWVDNSGMLSVFTPVPENMPAPYGAAVVADLKRSRYDEEDLILSGSEDEDMGLFDEQTSVKRTRTRREEERPFQPGSTPWLNRKRILCTNYVGYIWSTYQDTDHNSITISFFDQGEHRDIHFEDEDQFDIAALSDQGALLANSSTGKVFMRFHNSRVDSWELLCPDGIRTVALSDKIAVICTTNGYTRTFSVFGNPLGVTREARDPVLTCAAHDNIVMTIRGGSGGLNYTIEDAETQQYYQKNDPLDVAEDCTLSSLFFSDNGDPCVYDANGALSTLLHWRNSLQARWVPIFDGQECAETSGRQESYWPIGIFGDELLCVILKGQRQYPAVPLPVTAQMKLKIPGVEGTDAEYLLMNAVYAQTHAKVEALGKLDEHEEELADTEQGLDRVILKQFQAACNDNRVNRCLSIANLLKGDEALQIAAQIAIRYNMSSVAERIQNQL